MDREEIPHKQGFVAMLDALGVRNASVDDSFKFTVLGPAIADAASWHDNLQWVGAVATPHCAQYVNKFLLSIEEDPIAQNFFAMAFAKWQAPTKSGHIDTWTIAWPNVIKHHSSCPKKSSPLSWYYSQMSKIQIPKGTEDKFMHTEQFARALLCSTDKADLH